MSRLDVSAGDLISEPIITLHQLSDYAKRLDEQERHLYLEKLIKCDVDCPYCIPEQNWLATVK